ncbi:MAG: DUF3990 domain-containing protein [Spirochaetaceae bacterium]|jgi:hypothetical protein|nr:DUF3990 domain-containing protein [Spirochaetaceae bacterium]
MTIYHGSNIAVPSPKILPANRLLDFGEGFYTTSSPEQARRWAQRVSINKKTKEQIVSVYDFDAEKAAENLKIVRFNSPDSAWLRFVTACRSGRETHIEYDIAIGPVANDNVYATIQLFETGLLSETETIIRLKTEKIFDQILFHTIRALQYCTFVKHEYAKEASIEQSSI